MSRLDICLTFNSIHLFKYFWNAVSLFSIHFQSGWALFSYRTCIKVATFNHFFPVNSVTLIYLFFMLNFTHIHFQVHYFNFDKRLLRCLLLCPSSKVIIKSAISPSPPSSIYMKEYARNRSQISLTVLQLWQPSPKLS